MAKRRLMILALLLCFCLLPSYVQAASTTDAKEPIAAEKDCSLTIAYCCEDTAFSGQTVKLYKIAEVSANFQYTLTASFADSGLILNGVQTNGEWDVIRSTLEAYILANNAEPIMTATTDETGQADFASLKPGLYLASAVHVVQSDLGCSFDSALVSLPGLGADGLWQYSVSVSAKPELLPPIESDEEITLQVLKLWKDDGKNRPKSVEIEIFRDGASYETVTLSEETHWAYSWHAKDDGSDWMVVERNIPTGYTATVEERGTTFLVTNTQTAEDHTDPPKTGDTSNLLLYTVLMYVSGTMLILLGIWGKRNNHEKTN